MTDSGEAYCLLNANRILRRARNWSEVGPMLDELPTACQRPDVCPNLELGCQEISRRYLRAFPQRERVSQANAGARAAERAGRAA